MLARFVISQSSHDVDLKQVVGMYELSTMNNVLMQAGGLLHPCTDKSQLAHEFLHQMDMDSDSEMDGPLPSNVPDQAALVIDGMAVVNEQTVFKAALKNCNDLASYFVKANDRKGLTYESVCGF